jgi:tetratricopeptide (TPR) repeat protein
MGIVALVLFSACNPGNGPRIPTEEDEPNFRRGRQMERTGQNQIALEAFLKVIEKRGDDAPESHLEAGLIYLNHIKDPIAAIYHFRKYLEIKPNSLRAQQVEGLQKTAMRELAAKMPGRPFDAQLEVQEQIEKLTAENATLRNEIARLTSDRSMAQAPGPARNPAPVSNPDRGNTGTVESVVPVPAGSVVPIDSSVRLPPTPPANQRSSGQTYVIQRGDTLWKISEKVYGNGRHWQEIFDLNKDRIRTPTDLTVGVELRLP